MIVVEPIPRERQSHDIYIYIGHIVMSNLIVKHSDALERRASFLAYLSKTRVSHTAGLTAGLIRCILSIADLCQELQSKNNFTRMLVSALHKSHDQSGGSYELQVNDDGSIWIMGSFHIDELRKYLVTIPQVNEQIDVPPKEYTYG